VREARVKDEERPAVQLLVTQNERETVRGATTCSCTTLSVPKHATKVCLALSKVRRKELRAVNGYKRSTSLFGNRAGQQRLACARRTVQEHTLGALDPELGEHGGVEKWQTHE